MGGNNVNLDANINGSAYTNGSNVTARKKEPFYNILLRSLYDKNPPIPQTDVANLPGILSGSNNTIASRL